jgi:hypothetical protein
MITQVTLGLFEQQMHEGVSTNTTGAVQNVFLIQDLDGLIIHVERTSLIQTKIEGIIQLKNDVRTSAVGPKGTSWVKGAKGNKINFSGLRGSEKLSVELYDINGEGGLQNQLSGMELLRVALERVRRKGRLPKLVGLQSRDGSGGNRRSMAFIIGGEDFSGKIERAGGNRGSSGFLTRGRLRGDLLGEASGLLVSHINRTCEIGPLEIGFRNVQHELLKNKHDAANFVTSHNGFVNGVLEHGSNLGFIIHQIKEDIFQIFQGRYTF